MWISLACLGAASSHAQLVPQPPDVKAESYFVVDFASQQIIAARRADERVHPASLTKLMTSFVAFRALDDGVIRLDDQVLVSEKAWRTGGSRMFIEVDSYVTMDDLLRGLIVQSGNDASIAIAEHIAGNEDAFVGLMNAQAKTLGMHDTVYRNSSGLPAKGHYSSARDMATLARAILAEFPHRYARFSQREFSYNEIHQYNRNKLLWRDQSVDGLKTGYTAAAGYCMVSSAERGGMRLIAVVMGMPSSVARTEGSRALLEYGFENYETTKLFSKGERISEIRVSKGTPDKVGVGVSRDLYVTLPRGYRALIAASPMISRSVSAPLQLHQPVGEISVEFRGETILAEPLVALTRVAVGGLWIRSIDQVKLWLD